MKKKLAIVICAASLVTGVVAAPASASTGPSASVSSAWSDGDGGQHHFMSMMRMCGGGC